MISKSNLYKLFNHIATVYGLDNLTAGDKIIFAKQEGYKPSGDYMVLQFTTRKNAIGTPDINQVADGLEYKQDFEASLTIDVYGPNSESYVNTIYDVLEHDSVIEKAKSLGIIYFNKGTIRDLTNLLGMSFLDRFNFELSLRGAAKTKDTSTTYIESVENINKV